MYNKSRVTWSLTDTETHSQYYGKQFNFDFSYIKPTSMRELVQAYVQQYHQTQSKTLYKLYCELGNFKYFNSFAEQNGIRYLHSLSHHDICCFIVFLKTTVSKITKRPLSYAYQKKCLDTVKNLIRWGQVHAPEEVPRTEIFVGNEYIGTNSKLRIDFIPDEVMAQISLAVTIENDPYIKYGITILRTTAIRIEDMLRLKISCLKPHPVNGYTLSWLSAPVIKCRKVANKKCRF